jgi:hypothetical protein
MHGGVMLALLLSTISQGWVDEHSVVLSGPDVSVGRSRHDD